MVIRGSLWLLWLGAAMALQGAERLNLVWPTPNPAYAAGRPAEDYAQPTISGQVESAFFGCVRNSSSRFHEGVDLKATARDERGEALDPVFAVMDGVVLHANHVAGNSSYGRYIVVEHRHVTPPVMTLYAHLASVDDEVRRGSRVGAGQTIGIMGHSARGNHISQDRAHLHFEIGFWASEDFQSWYDWKKFGSKNDHGLMNGMNIIGIDPIDFYDRYRAGKIAGFQAYLDQLPVAFTVRVRSSKMPDFIRRYPSLFQGGMPVGGPGGWEIDFTSFGLPKRWRALPAGDPSLKGQSRATVIAHDPEVIARHACRNLVVTRRGVPAIGGQTETVLQLLFGFR